MFISSLAVFFVVLVGGVLLFHSHAHRFLITGNICTQHLCTRQYLNNHKIMSRANYTIWRFDGKSPKLDHDLKKSGGICQISRSSKWPFKVKYRKEISTQHKRIKFQSKIIQVYVQNGCWLLVTELFVTYIWHDYFQLLFCNGHCSQSAMMHSPMTDSKAIATKSG